MNLKTLSIKDLYTLAYPLTGEAYSAIIIELQSRDSYEDIEYSLKQSRSDDAIVKAIAIDTLAQIAFHRELSNAETAQINSAICENLNTTNERLLASTIIAAGRRSITDAIDTYEKLQQHESQEIRFAIAFALGFETNEKGIDILINLSKDVDNEVRNWATFALGSQIEDANSLIIDALLQRVDDQVLEVAGEAVVGLANKNYTPVDAIITDKLKGESINILIFEACTIRKNPIHYEHLKLWENSIEDDSMNRMLQEAIEACSQAQHN